MNLKNIWHKIQSRPITRVLAVLVLSGLVFVVTYPILSDLGLRMPSTGVSTGLKAPSSGGASEKIVSPQMIQPTPRYRYRLPIFRLIKPLFYVGIFLFIYFLLFQKKKERNLSQLLFKLGFLAVLVIFVFSSADLLRLGLRYYLKEINFTRSSYLFEKFARQLARRMSALLLSFPFFAFLNYKLVQKRTGKDFSLVLTLITGLFSLTFAYFLLNALFMWGLGVEGIELVDYTFPVAYFSILFPLSLLYLVVYLRKTASLR